MCLKLIQNIKKNNERIHEKLNFLKKIIKKFKKKLFEIDVFQKKI